MKSVFLLPSERAPNLVRYAIWCPESYLGVAIDSKMVGTVV